MFSDLQQKYDCPVYHAGDLFDYWKPSPALLAKTMEHLPKDFYTAYGNHDLPQHNIELAYKKIVNNLDNLSEYFCKNLNMIKICVYFIIHIKEMM